VLVAREHVVLFEPEPKPSYLGEEANDRFAPLKVARYALLSGSR